MLFIAIIALECVIYTGVLHFSIGRALHGRRVLRALFTLAITLAVYLLANAELSNIYLKSLVVLVVLSLIMSALYGTKVYIASFYTIATFYIFLFSETLVGNLFSVFYKQLFTLLVQDFSVFIVSALLMLAVKVALAVLLVLCFGKTQTENPPHYWLLVNLSLLFAYGITMIVFSSSNSLQAGATPGLIVQNAASLFAVLILVMGINVLLVRVFFLLTDFNIKEKRKSELEQHLSEMRQHNSEMQVLYTNMRQTAHDIENTSAHVVLTLNQAKRLEHREGALTRKIDDALEEMEKLTSSASANMPKLYTGILHVDTAIMVNASLASLQGIAVNIEAARLPQTNIDPIELYSIISNLMLNAIEATAEYKGEEDKAIYFSLQCDENQLWVEVRNPFANKLIPVASSQYKTSKAGPNHGQGLFFVEEVCSKYGGRFTAAPVNDTFVAQAIMPIN